MKKHKKALLFGSALLIAVAGILCVYFCYFHRYAGTEKVKLWQEGEPFTLADIATVEKTAGEPFVILNLADVQLCDVEDFFHRATIHAELTYLVNEVKPDLITLTGDQTWSNENLMSLRCLLSWLDSYEIPYAPIFGNHDCGNDYDSAVASRNKCCDLYESAKYCLFDRGPSNLGCLGNYLVNIVEDGEIVKTLYMLDSGYGDCLTDEQIAWVKWNAEGIKSEVGHYTEGMCFLHKPLPEYQSAYLSYLEGECEAIGDVFCYCSLSGSLQNGFFDTAKDIGITDVVCGHQHTNAFTLSYEGVRLTFAVKTGELSFYYDDGETNLNGGTVFTVGEYTEIEKVLVPRAEFAVPGSRNICNE